jgi:hypothetical protein
MQIDDELGRWLEAQPLDEPVEVDGESVYLKVLADGAELGACLVRDYAQDQLHDAMKLGFRSATEFDAGLGVSEDGSSLMLTQWLPHATGWLDAAAALENLLNQLGMWRAALDPVKEQQWGTGSNRNEQRLRKLFMGEKQ